MVCSIVLAICPRLSTLLGFFTLYLYVSEGEVSKIIFVLWMALCVIVPADLLRFSSKRFARTYETYLGFLMRESERVRSLIYHHATDLTRHPGFGKWSSVVHFRRQFRPITLSPRCRHSRHPDVSVRHICPISLTDCNTVSRGQILPRRPSAACTGRRRAGCLLACPSCVSP